MPKTSLANPAGVEIDGNKLRELRKLRGEGLTAFAARCGFSFGYLGQIERTERKTISPEAFASICDALDIAADNRRNMLTPAARRRSKKAAA